MRQLWTKYARNRPAVAGFAIVLGFALLGLLAPWLAPAGPSTPDRIHSVLPTPCIAWERTTWAGIS